MGSRITFSKNRIVVNEENLNTYMAVTLMQNIVDMYPSGKTKCKRDIVIDLSRVVHFSHSGMLIIRRLMDEFEELKLEGHEIYNMKEFKEKLKPISLT